jgi:hypothetical protein
MAASTPEAQMREVLSDFSPDWSKVVALASSHGSAVTDVRAGPDEDTALHSAAYWGAVEAIGTCGRKGRASPPSVRRGLPRV